MRTGRRPYAAALTFWSRNPRRWQIAKTRSARFMV
jgi:hypothetical protein